MDESPQARPPRKLPWYEDPERRQAHLDKLQQGRMESARRRNEAAEQEEEPPPIADGEPNYPDLIRALRAIRWDRVELSVADGLLGCIEEARAEGLRRLEARRSRESGHRCSYCGETFPGGRHTEAVSWTDLESGSIIGRLSCARLTCRSQMREEHDRERRKRIG